MATTTYSAIRYPISTDSPNLAQYYQNLASDVDQKVIVPVANATARNALSAKYDGMLVYTISEQRYYRWNSSGAAWTYAGGAAPPIAAVTIAGGWTAYTGRAPGVYLDAGGLVHLTGALTNNATFNPNVSATMLTLPTGFRPASTETLMIPAASVMVTVDVHTDGTVATTASTSTSITSGTGFYLSAAAPFHLTFAGTVPLA